MKKLNLGCGNEKLKDCINVDNNQNCTPDVIHNLNEFPYPFDNEEFDEIYLDHVIEHLDNPLSVLQEIFRISKNGTKVVIRCPHFSCNWLHPGHKSAIGINLFNYLGKDGDERYGNTDFKVDTIHLFWIRNKNENLKNRNFLIKALNKLINLFANLHIGIAERVWCYWVGGFEEIIFESKVIKKQ